MRGALIVIEGIDRIGKSTQAIKLVESLSSAKHGSQKVQLIKFPDRLTAIGQLINEYLKGDKQMDDHVIHLLFSANRWEQVSRMRSLLASGTTLIVDRYAYSGVAYSAAKPCMNLEWCRSTDRGLPLPDCVLFLTDPNNTNFNRNGFGDEIYELKDFQLKVIHNYRKLYDDNYWKIIEANKDVDTLHNELLNVVKDTIEKVKNTNEESMNLLWDQKNK